MADLTFTAGLDDRQFKEGMRGLTRQTNEYGRSLAATAKIGFGIFGIGTASGLARGIVRTEIRGATNAVREYAKTNIFAAQSLSEIGKSFRETEASAGRFLTMLVRANQELVVGANLWAQRQITNVGVGASLVGNTFNWLFNNGQNPVAATGMQVSQVAQEEFFTRQFIKAKLLRDMGSIEEDVLRLRGKDGAADILLSRRKSAEYGAHLNELFRRGDLTKDELYRFSGFNSDRALLEQRAALLRGTRGFSGDIPRSLRASISGVFESAPMAPKTFQSEAQIRAAGRQISIDAAERQRQRNEEKAEKHLQEIKETNRKIEHNTRGGARYN